MAQEFKVDFLGRVPIDPHFAAMVETDGDESYIRSFEKSSLFPIFQTIGKQIANVTSSK